MPSTKLLGFSSHIAKVVIKQITLDSSPADMDMQWVYFHSNLISISVMQMEFTVIESDSVIELTFCSVCFTTLKQCPTTRWKCTELVTLKG